jgi:transposase
MIDFSDVRIFLCTTPTNMHCSFDRLMGRAQEIFDQDPCSGHLFLFLNRSRDRIKILFWDRDGFCMFYKRQEQDNPSKFVFPGFAFSAHNGRIGTSGLGFLV